MTELDPKAKARIASRAQAAAHKALRDRHPEEYQASYQEAKRLETERELRRAGQKT